ncbi:hypothetical protein J3R30DRAFT_3733013 [Lentinula aciculospora]|uniref:Uncharacterized protein n=1 Tax=Lentinula aciculospora TaxID=153920 RepID=A0A9W9AFX6_9AGAR|nr:hypothetical protein J3R30DRAFT_3733013 [Lentinula aciculospora]
MSSILGTSISSPEVSTPPQEFIVKLDVLSSKTCSRLSPHPLMDKFPYEPIYSYPMVSKMGSHIESTEKLDINITLLGVVAFNQVCKDTGIEPILFDYVPSNITAKGSSTEEFESQENGSTLLAQYAEFTDVFNKSSSKELPAHQSYDIKIDLEEGAEPPLGRLYRGVSHIWYNERSEGTHTGVLDVSFSGMLAMSRRLTQDLLKAPPVIMSPEKNVPLKEIINDSVHHVVCADIDGDGIDKVLVACMGSTPLSWERIGVCFYKRSESSFTLL